MCKISSTVRSLLIVCQGIVYERKALFLSCKQWWAIFVHHVTWRVFLYLVVVITSERDMSRTGELTEKKIFFPVYFVSAVKKKNASVGKHFCVAGVSTAVILKARFSTDSICIESDGGML